MEEVRLIAFRPEAVRFDRLARIYATAENAARAGGDIARWEGALAEVHDSKGDLTVVWRSEEHKRLFAHHFDDAWRIEGEREPIVHSLVRPDSPSAERPGPAPRRGLAFHTVLWTLSIGVALGAAATFYILRY